VDHDEIVLILWIGYFLIATLLVPLPRRPRRSPPPGNGAPGLCVLLPVRGLSEANERLVDRLLAQDYPTFRVLLLVESADDPGALLMQRPGMAARAQLVIGGLATLGAQKLTSLLAGLAMLTAEDRIVVFCDADSLPPADWLTRLTAPLRSGEAEVATTFRLLLPRRPRLGSCAYAAADVALALAPRERRRVLCWGGSTAVLAARIPDLELPRRWRSVYNDDLVLSEGVAAAGLRGKVLLDLMLPSLIDVSLPAALRFERRQFLILRLYAPTQALLVALGFVLPLVFWVSATVKLLDGVALAPYAMATVFALDGLRAWRRSSAVCAIVGPELARRWRCAALLAWLLPAPLALMRLIGVLRAYALREVTWAGIRYRLHSPRDVRVVSRAPPQDQRGRAED